MKQTALCRIAAMAGSIGWSMLSASAMAQPPAPKAPANIPGVAVSPAPPVVFDAVHASDDSLASYGFPPRPDAARAPAAYAHWAKAVGAHPKRIVPELQATDVYHGPNTTPPSRLIANTVTSTNWSGYAVDTGAAAWAATSISSIATDLIVPAVSARTCNTTWEYSSAWVGIDGYASSDVLQAGIEADAICTSTGPQTFYSPWYEWYPFASTRITNLPTTPGQSLYVHVWATSATVGYAYLQNLNSNLSVSITLTPPAGTTLRGESAEWIVESPQVSGSLATLPLYGLDFFEGATSSNRMAQIKTPASPTAVAITLSRGGVTYSVPGLLGVNGTLFTSH